MIHLQTLLFSSLLSLSIISCNFNSNSVDLSGEWLGKGYKCYGPNDYLEEIIYLTQTEDSLIATKIDGDGCVTSGEISWRGSYNEGDKHIPVQAQTGNIQNPNNRFIQAELEIATKDSLILRSLDSDQEVTFIRID